MDNTKNPTATESPEKIEKRRHALIANCLTQLGTALGQTIPAERVALYCRALTDIGEAQMKFAFDQALRHLGEFLPSVRDLRGYAENWRPAEVVTDCRHILDRGDKPPGWEQLTPEELAQMQVEARSRARQIDQQVATAAEQHTMRRMTESEFERRRREQLARFRAKNSGAGEA